MTSIKRILHTYFKYIVCDFCVFIYMYFLDIYKTPFIYIYNPLFIYIYIKPCNILTKFKTLSNALSRLNVNETREF